MDQTGIRNDVRWKLPTALALTVVIILAVGSALAGLVVHGTVGAVIGAAIGGLAGVAAGYVPIFQDRAGQRRTELEQAAARHAEARKSLLAASEPRLDEAVSGPSLLLRPELAVVEFTGREAELAELRAWCELDRPRSVRVLAGAGGVGKTRLALKIGGEWRAAGRTLLVVAAGREAEALAKARGVTSGPVLLVVDYVESRTGLGDLLRAVLDDPGPVRVLLLARSLGEWWERLAEQSAPAVAQLLWAANPILLQAPVNDTPDGELTAAALPFFAARLGVPAPGGVVFDLPPRRVPVLVLHTAALVAVLRSMTRPPGSSLVTVAEGVLGELLEHEARYWRRAAAASGLREDGPVLKAVVAASVLLGAGDLEEAAAVAGRVPDLAGAHAWELRQWARWLFGLYPAGPDRRLGTVQPDLLAEHHAVTQLAADPALVRAVLHDLTARQAVQALTVLARAWELHRNAEQVIEAALRGDLISLAIPAAEVAVQTRPRMGELLASAFRHAPATVEKLIQIQEALPYPSVTLATADLALIQRIRRELPPDTEMQTIARWNYVAGARLADIGRSAEALPLAEQAVVMYRELAAAMPDQYRPHLADSLTNLGIRFWELGRPADALSVTEQAVAMYRELAAALPDQYRPDLAQSLSNLAGWFSELGRPADGLPVIVEAVMIRRELAAAMPDRYRPDLANSQLNLGITLSDLGRPSEALLAAQQAVAIYRELAAAMPDRYRPGLAYSLPTLGNTYSALGRPADALPTAEEAVAMYRELAAAMPDRYRPDLAYSLTTLSSTYSALGRPADALPTAEEAVAMYRELAAAMPDRYRPDLANSLTTLADWFSELGRPADALPTAEEAVAMYRELAAALPDRYRPRLANSLTTLSSTYSELGRPADALPPAEEAVAMYRELAAALPDRYRPGLANSLTTLSSTYSALGRPADALPTAEEAVAMYRELAAALPDRHRPGLAGSLFILGTTLSALGRPADALPTAEEAVAMYRELAAALPDRHRRALAGSLFILGTTLSALAARPMRCQRPRRRSRCTGSWPPPCPTDTARVSPGPCSSSGPRSQRWAARPMRCRLRGGGRDVPGAGRRAAGPTPPGSRRDPVHPREHALRVGPPGRCAAAGRGGGRDVPGAGRRAAGPTPPGSRRVPVHPRGHALRLGPPGRGAAAGRGGGRDVPGAGRRRGRPIPPGPCISAGEPQDLLWALDGSAEAEVEQ